MKAFGARFDTGLAPLICVLILAGTCQCEARLRRSVHDLQSGPVDDLLDPMFADPSAASTGDDTAAAAAQGNGGGRRRVLSPTDRLGYCDESTVSRLTPFHYQIIEGGLRVYRCWSPRVGRLISLLQAEQGRGASGPAAAAAAAGDESGRGRQRLSANEGYRLRCRILFKFDTCRSNFAKYYSAENPEISTEWPEEILRAINGQEEP